MHPEPAPPGPGQAPSGLAALERRLAHDLACLNLPAAPWVLRWDGDQAPDHDVIVIGAGMLGLCAAAALRLRGIDSVLCVDRAPNGREGPWVTFARMRTLRTAKSATGPALGLPALTFRAWFEAQHGVAAWESLGRIPRAQWMAYLRWYREVLDIGVRNDAEVIDVAPRTDGLFDVTVRGDARALRARRVVFATGIDGMGAPSLPAVATGLGRDCHAHSSAAIDFEGLRGRRVGVVGAGASAMDNAATALEHGASRVDVFVRRDALPAIDKFGGVSSEGLTIGYAGLPDSAKWALMRFAMAHPVPAPSDSARRVFGHLNARLHLASPVLDISRSGDALSVTTPHGRTELDFMIFATGFACAPASRPELARLAPMIRLWRDRFDAPIGEESAVLGSMPDLAGDFSFQPRAHADGDVLSRLYCFCFDATLSHGKLTSGVPALSEAAGRLVRGIAASLLREDSARHIAAFRDYSRPELTGDEWRPEQIVAGGPQGVIAP